MAIRDIRKGILDLGRAIADAPLKGKRRRAQFEQKLFFDREAVRKQIDRDERAKKRSIAVFKGQEDIRQFFKSEDRKRQTEANILNDTRSEFKAVFDDFTENPSFDPDHIFRDLANKADDLAIRGDSEGLATLLKSNSETLASIQEARDTITINENKRQREFAKAKLASEKALEVQRLRGGEPSTPSQVKIASEKRAREKLTKIDFDGTKRTIKWVRAQLVKEESFDTGSKLGKRLIRILSKYDEFFDLGSPGGNKGFEAFLLSKESGVGKGESGSQKSEAKKREERAAIRFRGKQ